MRHPIIRPGPITTGLDQRRNADAARYKAERVVLAVHAVRTLGTHDVDMTWKQGDMTYIVRHVRFERDMVACDVVALRDGEPVPINNPVYIYNPPIFVPDSKPFTTEEDGVIVTATDLREDPVAAFRLVIEKAVHANLSHLHGRG